MRITIKSVAITAIAALFALTSCNNDLKADIEALQAEQELQNFQSGDNQVASLETQIEAMNAATDMFTKEIAPKLSAIGTWLKETESGLTDANKALAKAIETKSAAADFLTAVNAFKTVADKAVEAGQKLEGPEDFALETLCTQLAAYKDAIEETIKATDKSVAEKNTQAKVYAAAAKAAGDAAIKTINKHASDNAEATAALTDKMVPALQARVKASLDAIVSIHEALSGKPTAEAIKAAYALFEETTNANVLAMEDVLLGTIKGRLDTAGFTNFKNAYLNRFDGYEAWKIYVDATLVKHASEIAKLRADLEDEVAALQEQIDNLETELEQQVEKINANIGSVKDNLQQQIDKINAYIGSVKDNLQQQIDTIDKTIEAIQKDLEGVHVEMDKMGKSIEAIQKDLLGVHGEINTINGEINTINGKIVAIDTEIEKLWKAVNLLNADKDTEGSVKYYVEQLRINLQAQIDVLEGRVTVNEAEIRALKARVQSLVFVPQFQDLKFGLPFSVVTDGTYSKAVALDTVKRIVYKVSPDSLAKRLADNANAIFTFSVESGLDTRATANNPKLEILSAVGNNENGKIEFVLKQSGFYATTTGNGTNDVNCSTYAIALRIDDESHSGVHISSEYTGTTVVPSPLITVDVQNVYRKLKACKDGSGNPVSNVTVAVADNHGTNPENLEIKYTGDVTKIPSYKTTYKPSYKAKSSFKKDSVVLYENTYLAATVTGLTGHYTYDQLDSLGFKMSDYVKHREEEAINTTDANYGTTVPAASYGPSGRLVNAPTTAAFSPISLYDDGTTTKMKDRKHLVGKRLGKTITYYTGIHNESKVTRTAKVSFIQADDIYFKFTLDTLKWTYANDAEPDHVRFNGGSFNGIPTYHRVNMKPMKVEASTDGGLNYQTFEDGADKFWGVELRDFNKLTRNNYYEASETTTVDWESDKVLNPVMSGSNPDNNAFINTKASYNSTDKSLTFGTDNTTAKHHNAFYRRGVFATGTAANKRTATYTLRTRATSKTSAAELSNSKNAAAYMLYNDRDANDVNTATSAQFIAAKSTFVVTTQDRKRNDIVITGKSVAEGELRNYPSDVTPTAETPSLNLFKVLINGQEGVSTSGYYEARGYWCTETTSYQTNPDYEHYELQSGDLKQALYEAFKTQGIFSSSNYASAAAALTGEFDHAGLLNPGTSYNKDHNAYFKLMHAGETLTLRSHGGYGSNEPGDYHQSLLTSDRLHKLVRIYPDYSEEKHEETGDARWIKYIFYTYTGQKVVVWWSLGAKTDYELRSLVNPVEGRTFNFVPNSGTPKQMYMSNIIGIFPKTSSVSLYKRDVTGGYCFDKNNSGEVTDTHLVPEFWLDHAYTGTDLYGLFDSYPNLRTNSNLLKYDGTSENVEVKGRLWVYSGKTSVRFPVTSKIKVGSAEASSSPIIIKKP